MGTNLRLKAEEWLKVIGSTPVEIEDPETEWHLEFEYPAKSPQRLHVAQPKGRPETLIIAWAVQVSPEHLKAFDELDDDSKAEFLWDLRRALNVMEVGFRLEGVNGERNCPTRFQVSVTRYDDGLTLDSFAASVGAVFKTGLGAIWVVQQHLGDRGFGGAGRFDFKKIGL